MSNSAIVTGYSTGLGLQFTRLLLSRDWKVIGVSRQSDAPQLDQKLANALTVVNGSVSSQNTVDDAYRKATEKGDLSVVINCAGVGVFGEIGSYTANDVAAVLDGNLAGLMLFSDMAVSHMREKGGSIINVMSTASKKLRPAETMYVGTKFGAKGYTRALREAVKVEKIPIKIYEVYPCGMNTPFWEKAIRPVATGQGFPSPVPIAEQVMDEVLSSRSAYCREFTFERS